MVPWTQSLVFTECMTVKLLFPLRHKIPNKKYWSLFYFGNLYSYKNEISLRKSLPRLKRNKVAVNIILYAGTHSYIYIKSGTVSSSAAFVFRLGFYISSFRESQANGVSAGKFLRIKSGGHLSLCYTAPKGNEKWNWKEEKGAIYSSWYLGLKLGPTLSLYVVCKSPNEVLLLWKNMLIILAFLWPLLRKCEWDPLKRFKKHTHCPWRHPHPRNTDLS